MQITNMKKCLACAEEIKGRSDKKFCGDYCRNSYNNQINRDPNNYARRINHILRKNRRILAELNPHGKAKVHRDKLFENGFNFNYFTNQYITKSGNHYHFVYDYGYLELDGDMFALVFRSEYVK